MQCPWPLLTPNSTSKASLREKLQHIWTNVWFNPHAEGRIPIINIKKGFNRKPMNAK